MSHNHSHNHLHSHNGHDHSSSKNIAVAFFLNLSFTVIEIIGGLITNSVAIISDALHDFGDSISLGLAWYFEKVAKKSPNKKFTYGYKRFSLLGALINSTILLVGSIIVIIECVKRIAEPQDVNVKGMIILAVIGVVINGIAVLRTRKGKGVNEKVVSLHLLEDVLGWAAVLIVSIVMLFVDLPILDPLLSIGISCFVLYNVYKNLKVTFKVILQGVPSDLDVIELREKVLKIPNVVDVHDFHIWSLDSEYNIASMHVVIKDAKDLYSLQVKLKTEIKNLLNEEGIKHTTIEFETEQEECTHCYNDDLI
ncbi:MAG: cation diffusion facilitator family transporter [Bacteroidales bacterium]|jgi:cobalt-zinc-cadmium efflux system protein|nr:cation diffusion facilitator family transporter [Bacteroidales bacterium]